MLLLAIKIGIQMCVCCVCVLLRCLERVVLRVTRTWARLRIVTGSERESDATTTQSPSSPARSSSATYIHVVGACELSFWRTHIIIAEMEANDGARWRRERGHATRVESVFACHLTSNANFLPTSVKSCSHAQTQTYTHSHISIYKHA